MSDWINNYPDLSEIDGPCRKILTERSRIVEAPEGTVIFSPGQAPDNHLLLLEGMLRVQQISESGREIVLYRVHAGESCILTTACLLAFENYSAEGITETGIRAAAIPQTVFDELVARSGPFRRFVFAAYSKRITSLFTLIDDVAFGRVDIRLAQKLVELGDETGHVHLTHQQLAVEVGTAREVVSRQLQEFQRRGWISAARGDVQLTDHAALGAFAGTE
jgi:CRP/FNR family transcriptional regulator, anaerobic regulatory protein